MLGVVNDLTDHSPTIRTPTSPFCSQKYRNQLNHKGVIFETDVLESSGEISVSKIILFRARGTDPSQL